MDVHGKAMPALQVVDKCLVEGVLPAPPSPGSIGGLWKGQCQPEKLQRKTGPSALEEHPGRPGDPMG